jgi:hypothetical protein
MAKSGLNSPMKPVATGKVPKIAANTFVTDVKLTQPQQIKFDGSSRIFPKR